MKKTHEYFPKSKGKGGKNKQACPKMVEIPSKGSLDDKDESSPTDKDPRDRNSYRKNHYQNRGKSYNQQKKIKGTKPPTEKLWYRLPGSMLLIFPS